MKNSKTTIIARNKSIWHYIGI